VLAGVDVTSPDGTLGLDDDCLAALDLVIASVHSAFNQDRQQMTDRVLRAIENPNVDILAHPTGRRLLRREPYPIDMEAIVDAAGRHGVALEINCQVERLDLNDVHSRLARERDVPLVISSDGHSRHAFGRLQWGVLMAAAAGSSRATFSTPVRSTISKPDSGVTEGARDQADHAVGRRSAGRDQAALFQDVARDDPAGLHEGPGSAQVDGDRR
jgi:histidinol phosphatase-like PHP family hydrolase